MSSAPEPGVSSGADRFSSGATLTTEPRTLALEDIREFARLTGDENPLHLDAGFASGQMFGGPVAHGLLTLAATLGLWYRSGFFGDRIVVFVGIDRLRFLRPVRPGERIRARLTVRGREPSPRGDRVELDCSTLTERDEEVLVFAARLLVSEPHRTR